MKKEMRSPVIQTSAISTSRQEARREIVRQIEQGVSAKLAKVHSTAPMHRTTIYRLLKQVQREGEGAFNDGRHGHPVKLRGDVLPFVKDYCQSHPAASSSTVQCLLSERFGLSISISQLNRVRAAHGLSLQPIPLEKKAENWHRDCTRLS